jgi:DNA-binding response OmpR family regulator
MNEDFQTLSFERSANVISEDLSPFHESAPLVLAADDNETHLLFIQRLMESKGFQCVTTTSPTTAVRIALEKRPSVVLCDINFGIGKSNGMDVFTEIRKNNATMPFVIISAFMQQEMKDRAAKLGITDYITKPIEPARLLATVRNLIGQKRAAL